MKEIGVQDIQEYQEMITIRNNKEYIAQADYFNEILSDTINAGIAIYDFKGNNPITINPDDAII